MTLRDFENLANKYIELKEENKKLKDQLLVAQTNEETFRLEMKDITQILMLDENTLFDDVKIYARSLSDDWNELNKWVYENTMQQKKFIKYLEDERKRFLSNFNTDGIPIIEVELLDVVLENYKKIMGLKKW